jgi:hypothetical protein
MEALGAAAFAAVALTRSGVPAPEQIRLTHASHACDMNIYFATANTTAAGYVPTVRYGTTGLSKTVTGTSDSYVIFTIESPALHFVPLTGLSCKTQYSYQVGDGVASWSPVLKFTTGQCAPHLAMPRWKAHMCPAPSLVGYEAGDKSAYPFSYIMYADMVSVRGTSNKDGGRISESYPSRCDSQSNLYQFG